MRANAINMRRSSKGRVTYADLMAIRAGQGGRCRYCRCDLDEAVEYCDHIKPIKLGGSNWPWNIQYLCFDCSKRKGWKHPIDFETEEGFFGGGWVGLFKPVEYKKSSMICEMVK
jgi:5-methylcytosine-specific restriction endonuclease McrA